MSAQASLGEVMLWLGAAVGYGHLATVAAAGLWRWQRRRRAGSLRLPDRPWRPFRGRARRVATTWLTT